MDWFPWYPSLYKADTLDLSLEEDGAYRRLIDHYMETRLPLPNSDNALARIIGISINDFHAIAQQVRSKLTAKGELLHIKRCDIELDRQDNLSRKRSNVAKEAHEKRRQNNDLFAIAEQKHSNSTDTRQDKTRQDKESKTLVISNDEQNAFDLWNILAGEIGLAKVQKISKPRLSKIKARLKDAGGIEGWKAALEIVRGSSFLSGKKTDWKADIDFLLTESKFTKIMEGSYNDNGNSNSQTNSGGGNIVDALNSW